MARHRRRSNGNKKSDHNFVKYIVIAAFVIGGLFLFMRYLKRANQSSIGTTGVDLTAAAVNDEKKRQINAINSLKGGMKKKEQEQVKFY